MRNEFAIISNQRNYRDYPTIPVESTLGLKKLNAAVKIGDPGEVDLIAHNCGGASANCGMVAVVAPLRELERMGRENQLNGALQLVAETEREFNRIKIYLLQSLP